MENVFNLVAPAITAMIFAYVIVRLSLQVHRLEKSLRATDVAADNDLAFSNKLSERVGFLEWRVSHPEITFSGFTDMRGMIVKNNGNTIGEIMPVLNPNGGEVIAVEFEIWGNPDLKFEYLNGLKASLEKYGTQLFK